MPLGEGQQAQLASQQQSLQELQRGAGISEFQAQRGLGDALGGIRRNQREAQQATNQLRRDLSAQEQQALQTQAGNLTNVPRASRNLSRGAASAFDDRMGDVDRFAAKRP